jgi:FKBP-type peptidyl-prolyl cis-trans isomerase SlyD
MKIEPGKLAKIVYKLYDAGDNELIEEIPPEKPIVFRFGLNHLFPDFEKNLTGLAVDDTFDFIIKAEDAYGPVDTYAIFDIPKDTFEIDGKIPDNFFLPGKKVSMHDNNGQQHIGKMIKIMKESVTIDFNHPLAGKDLRYVGKVLEVFETNNQSNNE